MPQFIVLIQNNAPTEIPTCVWDTFFAATQQSGLFKGGSAIGARERIGDTSTAKSTEHICGYMIFETEDEATLNALLSQHPVVVHGGSIELCALPET